MIYKLLSDFYGLMVDSARDGKERSLIVPAAHADDLLSIASGHDCEAWLTDRQHSTILTLRYKRVTGFAPAPLPPATTPILAPGGDNNNQADALDGAQGSSEIRKEGPPGIAEFYRRDGL